MKNYAKTKVSSKAKGSKPSAKATTEKVPAVVPRSSVFSFTHHSIVLGVNGERVVTIGELVFNDKDSRNSFRVETAKELAKFLPQIEMNCDVLMFRAEGRVFCSGGNLKDHVEQGALKSQASNRLISQTLSKLNELKIPTIAIVQGDVLGGGLELISAFDVVMAAPHALFGFWQRRMGLAFGWGGGARLARRVGSSALVVRLGLEARALTASEAFDRGLVDLVCPTWSMKQEAMVEALRLASLPKISVGALKAVRAVPAAESAREQRDFEKLWFGPIHKMRLESFKRRR